MTKLKPHILFLLFLQLLSGVALGLERKHHQIIELSPSDDAPKIDGQLNESIYGAANGTTGFYMLEPDNGPELPADFETNVYFFFDEEAIYIGAILRDPEPDKILLEVSSRDQQNRNNDVFSVHFNPYNDGQNDVNFYVTSSGVQTDSRTTVEGDDLNWNAVWESAVTLHDSGWSVEMRIPFFNLRAPAGPNQTWGLNMMRYIRRNRTRYSWNFVDRSFGTPEQQNGRLLGMSLEETPVRLSALPYASSYTTIEAGQVEHTAQAGVDLKYGINEAFTLDVTTIPDFGQTRFDNVVLNLSPFEVEFDEYRPFFTEGTEIFSKGGLFYSRRVGGRPINYGKAYENLAEGEQVISNPTQTRLLNAFKLSGRTDKRLGIGVFNGITAASYAVIQNTEGEERTVETQPLTNYTVAMADQLFGQNNFATLIHTRVERFGPTEDASVTGYLHQWQNKNNSLRVKGQLNWSSEASGAQQGLRSSLTVRDIKGQWQWTASHEGTTRYYDPNSLGFLTQVNELNHSFKLTKNQFTPKGFTNRQESSLGLAYMRLQNPSAFRELIFFYDHFLLTKNWTAAGMNLAMSPISGRDYYETRDMDRYYAFQPYVSGNFWVSMDYRKPLAIDAGFDGYRFMDTERQGWGAYLRPVFRASNHLSGRVEVRYRKDYSDIGWVATPSENEIIFGVRNRNTTISSITANYNFNAQTFLNLTFRHYWGDAQYTGFFEVGPNGGELSTEYTQARDVTFNQWNLDLQLNWWFLPGSQVTFFYRNAVQNELDRAGLGIRDNFTELFNEDMLNRFSIRIMYFLDYNYLTKKNKRG